MHTADFITKTQQHLHPGSIGISHRGGMKKKQVMKNVLLVSSIFILIGCANKPPTVGSILTETKTERDRTVSCPTTMIKVCDGPDKETVAKYENLYCSCSSRRDVERALRLRMWDQINI